MHWSTTASSHSVATYRIAVTTSPFVRHNQQPTSSRRGGHWSRGRRRRRRQHLCRCHDDNHDDNHDHDHDHDDHDDHDDNSRLQFAKVVEGSTVIGSSVSTPKVKPSSSPVHTFLSAGALLVLAPFFVGILCMLGYVLGLVAFKRTSSQINTIMRAVRMIEDNLVFGAVEESSEDERAEGLLGGGHADNAIELTELRDRTVLSFESIEAESSSSSEDDAGEV